MSHFKPKPRPPKYVGRDTAGRAQIGDDRGRRVRCVDVEHIATCDGRPEALRVGAVLYFENTAAYVRGMFGEKPFDVMAIHGAPAIEAPLVAERRQATQGSEPGRAPQAAKALSQQPPLRGKETSLTQRPHFGECTKYGLSTDPRCMKPDVRWRGLRKSEV